MNFTPLRIVLMLDGIVLGLIGALFIAAPAPIAAAFHFADTGPSSNYMIGLWGCALATLGVGYVVASKNPVRHRIWVQIGIARGALELGVGAVHCRAGHVSFQQAWPGLAIAVAIIALYTVLYPRRPRVVMPSASTVAGESRDP